MSAPDAISARYGRTRKRRRRDVLLLVIGGVATAIIVVAWVIWAGLDGGTQIQAKDLGHTLRNEERLVDVTWQLSVPAGTETACAVQALNEEFTVVGWKVVEIPASDRPLRTFTETVRVAQEANTGLISHCWLT